MTPAQIKKTADWLKKNGIRFEACEDGVHVDGRLSIPSGKRVSLPALVEVSGSVDVGENATLTAPALVKSGYVYVRENATLTAPALVEVSGSVDVRENATLTAPALVEVSGYVDVRENTTLTAPALVKSGYVYVRENATLTAPALVEVSRSVYVRENATLTAPALVKSGSVDVGENATLTAPALRTIGNVAYATTIFGHKVTAHDGIGAVTVSEKTRGDVTIRCARKAKFEDGKLVGDKMYVVSQGEHNAHGDTLDQIPGGLPDYLKAGARYTILSVLSGPGGELFIVRCGDLIERIMEFKGCSHLNGADWIPVYADEESMVEAQSVITDNPRHLTAQESSATKNVNVGAFAKTSLKQTVPTWADVGPGLLEALKHLLAQVDEACGSVIPQGSFSHGKKRARAAIAAAEKVESHEG